MSSRNTVIWREGLFVKPQHFQQMAKASDAAMLQRLGCLNPGFYGFSELRLNVQYQAFGKVAITSARGVMPDGSVFDIPTDMAPPAALDTSGRAIAGEIVYLCLPLSTDGGLEVAWPESYANSRYLAKSLAVKDTHSIDGDMVDMDLAVPNLQLKLGGDDSSTSTRLAIGRILDRRPDGSLLMDESFYPTCVSLDAMPGVKVMLDELTGLIRGRATNLAERIGSSGQSGVADVADFSLLQALNRWHPYFQHLARQPQVHPEQLYIAMAQAAGELVTFTEASRLPDEYPPYQHNDCTLAFKTLEHELRRSLGTLLQPRAVSLPIIEQQFGVRTASLADTRLLQNAEFVLAVRASLPADLLRQQFTQKAKVTAQETLPELVRLQLPGIPLVVLPAAPRELPFHAGFSYFELDRRSPAWQCMKDSSGFGFHIAGEFPQLEMQFWAIRSESPGKEFDDR